MGKVFTNQFDILKSFMEIFSKFSLDMHTVKECDFMVEITSFLFTCITFGSGGKGIAIDSFLETENYIFN